MLKKINVVFVSILLVSLLLAGTLITSADYDPNRKGELVIYSMMNPGEPHLLWQEGIIEDFQKDYPNIDVELVASGREILNRVRPRILAGNPPDIVDQSTTELYPLIQEGILTPLTEYFDTNAYNSEEKWEDTFLESIFTLPEIIVDGDYYLVPRTYYTSGFFYDKRMFREYGLEIPETWDEMLNIMDVLKQNGISPIAADGTIPFYNAWYYSWLAIRTVGADKYRAACAGEISWKSDPGFLEAAEKLTDIIEKDYFAEGYKGSIWPAGQVDWVQGGAGLLLCGTWIPSELKNSTPPDYEMGFFTFPGIEGGAEPYIQEAWCNAWAIPESAKNKEEAILFLKYATQEKYMSQLADLLSTAPIKGAEYPEVLRAQEESFERAPRLMSKMAGLESMAEYYEKVFQRVNDPFFFGELDPEEFIEKLEEETIRFYNNK